MPAPALPNLLLVEGTSDQLFFRALCKTLGLDTRTTVKVAPPRELQASAFNTKQGVLNHLPVLLRQLDDGQLRHLGVVIDADSPPDGGFPATRDRITRDLAGFGSSLKPEHPHSAGLLFAHDDGLPDIGGLAVPSGLRHRSGDHLGSARPGRSGRPPAARLAAHRLSRLTPARPPALTPPPPAHRTPAPAAPRPARTCGRAGRRAARGSR